MADDHDELAGEVESVQKAEEQEWIMNHAMYESLMSRLEQIDSRIGSLESRPAITPEPPVQPELEPEPEPQAAALVIEEHEPITPEPKRKSRTRRFHLKRRK